MARNTRIVQFSHDLDTQKSRFSRPKPIAVRNASTWGAESVPLFQGSSKLRRGLAIPVNGHDTKSLSDDNI